MRWGLEGTTATELIDRDTIRQSIKKTKASPRVVNLTYYLDVQFVFVEDPIFQYHAYYTQPRDVQSLAMEQREFLNDIGRGLEDVDLPANDD